MRNAFLTLCLILLTFLPVFSQLQKKYIEHGDYLLANGNSLAAVIYYKKAMDMDSSNYELSFQLASAYRKTNNYNRALHYYKRCSKLDRGRKLVVSLYYAAEIEKLLGDYRADQAQPVIARPHNRAVTRCGRVLHRFILPISASGRCSDIRAD